MKYGGMLPYYFEVLWKVFGRHAQIITTLSSSGLASFSVFEMYILSKANQ